MSNFLDDWPQDRTNPEYRRLEEILVAHAKEAPKVLEELAKLAGIEPGTFPTDASNTRALAKKLIEVMGEQKKLRSLVEVAVANEGGINPDHRETLRLMLLAPAQPELATLTPRPPPAEGPYGALGQQIQRGVDALKDLTKGHGRVAVDGETDELNDVCRQIDILDNCKQLHDQFQRFEKLYLDIDREIKDVPDDQIPWTKLRTFVRETRFSDFRRALPKYNTALLPVADEVRSQDPVSAVDKLRDAIVGGNPKDLKAAMRRLRRVFDTMPADLNRCLYSKVKTVLGPRVPGEDRPSRVVEDVSSIQEGLLKLQLVSNDFDEGIRALACLSQELVESARLHNALQILDRELRMIRPSGSSELLELLDPMSEPLNKLTQDVLDLIEDESLRSSLDQAMMDLYYAIAIPDNGKSETLDLHDAIAIPDNGKSETLARLFGDYVNRVRHLFEDVDRNLLALCDVLKTSFRDPLGVMLRTR